MTDPDLVASHTVDWTGRWRGGRRGGRAPEEHRGRCAASCLVRARPTSPWCPQGGNTGLVGGTTPRCGDVVVDLRRLDELGAVDAGVGQVTVGAGVTLSRVQRTPRPLGLHFAVDLGARDRRRSEGWSRPTPVACTCCATARCGRRSSGSEAVLGTGDVVRANLDGLLKDNTGYDLPGLLCGSEGHPRHRHPGPAPPGAGARPAGRRPPGVRVDRRCGALRCPSCEGAPPSTRSRSCSTAGIATVAEHLGTPFPLAPVPPCVLLVELAGDDPLPELGAILQRPRPARRGDGGGRRRPVGRSSVALARGAPRGGRDARAWSTRPTSRCRSARCPTSSTRSVPRRSNASRRVRLTLVYGHLADGNLHVNIVGPAADDRPRRGRGVRAGAAARRAA